MNISELRDLIIVIWGIIGIIASTIMTILLTVLMLSLLRYIKPLFEALQVTLGKIDATVTRIQETINYAGDNVIKPLIHLASVVQGASRGFSILEKIFKRGNKNE